MTIYLDIHSYNHSYYKFTFDCSGPLCPASSLSLVSLSDPSKSKLYYDRRSVGLGIKHPSEAYDEIFIIVRVASPAQSFSGPSSVRFVTIFYCLRFETSISVASDSQGYGVGIRPRLHTGLSDPSLSVSVS
jgi:hypothetical protein